MGCFLPASKRQQDQRVVAQQIEQQLKDVKKEEEQIMLLLLGTGDAGKSTFCKQMRLLHDDGFTEREFFTFRNVLQENALVSIQKLLKVATTQQQQQDEDKKNLFGVGEPDIQELMSTKELTPAIAQKISKLWQDKTLKEIYQTNRRLHLSSATEYYFEHVRRFAEANFIPNEEDLIRARAQTTGITETKFSHKTSNFCIVDVGGQRSERRKWLHCFDRVTCVLYLAALDEYDMILQEDDKTNRLEESLNLFQEVTASHWFKTTPFALFLNKCDLFEKKILKNPLADHFPTEIEDKDRQLYMNFDNAVGFIRKKFESRFSGSSLYVFVTCAVDKNNCLKVFEAVQDAILTRAMLNTNVHL